MDLKRAFTRLTPLGRAAVLATVVLLPLTAFTRFKPALFGLAILAVFWLYVIMTSDGRRGIRSRRAARDDEDEGTEALEDSYERLRRSGSRYFR